MSDHPASTGPRELASRIYVELLGRTFTVEGSTLRPGVDPEALAVLSVKLAAIFLNVEDKSAGVRAPNSPFELDASNLAQWTKETPPGK